MNFYSIITVIIATFIQLSLQFELQCKFDISSPAEWYLRPTYTCTAVNLETTFKDRETNNVIGMHSVLKTNSDVKQFYAYKQNCLYIPRHLGELFPNLEILFIKHSNLQHLIGGDLEGLLKLKALDVSHNPVESIGVDFFKNHETIEKISFYNCNIKHIEAGSFDSLNNLNRIVFEENSCVNVASRDVFGVKRIVQQVYKSCSAFDGNLREIDDGNCSEENEKAMEMQLIKEMNEKNEHKDTRFPHVLIWFTIFNILITCILGVALHKIYKKNNFNLFNNDG